MKFTYFIKCIHLYPSSIALSLTHITTSSQLAWYLNWLSIAPASQSSVFEFQLSTEFFRPAFPLLLVGRAETVRGKCIFKSIVVWNLTRPDGWHCYITLLCYYHTINFNNSFLDHLLFIFKRRMKRESHMFSYLTCLHPNTLKLLNIFSQIETISLKIWETIVLACEMFTSDFHLTLENVACLLNLYFWIPRSWNQQRWTI